MKRTEAIEALAKLVKNAIKDADYHREFVPGDLFYEHANKILEAMELMGMLPPTTEFEMGGKIVRDNCWDQE